MGSDKTSQLSHSPKTVTGMSKKDSNKATLVTDHKAVKEKRMEPIVISSSDEEDRNLVVSSPAKKSPPSTPDKASLIEPITPTKEVGKDLAPKASSVSRETLS